MATETTKSVVGIWNRALHRIGETIKVQDTTDKSAAAEACRLHYGDCLVAVLELVHWTFATRQSQLNAAVDEWVITTEYDEDDLVRHSGIVYRSLQASNTGNTPDTSSAWWEYDHAVGLGWDYVYSLPSDFVSFMAFLTSEGARLERQPFDIVSDGVGVASVLVTNLPPEDFSVVEYTAVPGARDSSTGDVTENPLLYTRQFVDAVVWLLASELALAIKKDVGLAERMLSWFDHSIQLARSSDRNNVVHQQEPETPSVAIRSF